MSEPETPTTPYMANNTSADQSAAQDIWLDWDTEENESDAEKSNSDARAPPPPTHLVRIKEEPVSPSQSPEPPYGSEEMTQAPMVEVNVKMENPSPPPSPQQHQSAEEDADEAPNDGNDAEDGNEPDGGNGEDAGELQDEDEPDDVPDDRPEPVDINSPEDLLINGEDGRGEDDDLFEYNCHFCFAAFRNKTQLKEHYKVGHSTNSALRCNTCVMTFRQKRDYTRHMRMHITGKNLRCDRCLVKFESERQLIDHVLDKHFDDCKFICEYCDAPFTYKEDLLMHKFEEHTGFQDGYRCEHCNVGFKRKRMLELHVQSVHLELFKCQICRITITDRIEYRKHTRAHTRTDARKAFCDACGSRFKYNRTLKMHRLVCLGRRLNLMRFAEEAPGSPPGPDKNLSNTKDDDPKIVGSSIAKVIFDGDKLVTLHQGHVHHKGVSDVLIGGVNVTVGERSEVVEVTAEEYPGRKVNIEIYKAAKPAEPPKEATPPPQNTGGYTDRVYRSYARDYRIKDSNEGQSIDPSVFCSSQLGETIEPLGGGELTITVENVEVPSSSDAPNEDPLTNGVSPNPSENAECDTTQDRTPSALSHNSNAESDTPAPSEASSSNDNNQSLSSTTSEAPVENKKILLTTDMVKEETFRKRRRKPPPEPEEPVEKMSLAEILEAVESCSPAVRIPRKPGIKTEDGFVENIYKAHELPEKTLLALKAHGLPRVIKKPRLLSETIHQAMSLRGHGSETGFTCKTCDAEFVFKYDLIRHERTAHAAVLKCTQCSFTFTKKEELAQHTLETHFRRTGPRIGSGLGLFESLLAKKKAVMPVPPGSVLPTAPPPDSMPEQNFSCENCDANFAYEAELNHHMRIHGTEFKCNACKASFREKSALAKHMLSVHF
ncbi:unnamed protein product [Bemisia tabaci]|uniref:C2H2-type domain-containing protein n=1 Tax=Bemisia tabaci TaxID=7038 RepID=A0A9P0A8I9_BEMTA|nr:unnamed protein product [Bemisia tabaci]